jgi:lysophospholipase L1-like esterase
VSIRPSPARKERWYGAHRANQLIADYVSGERGMYFIDVTPRMFDAQNNIREDLFRWDGLSLNAKGYEVLIEAIKPVLIGAGYGGLRSSR